MSNFDFLPIAALLTALWAGAGAFGMPFAGDDFIFLAVMQPGGQGAGAVVDWQMGFFRPLSQGALLCGLAGAMPAAGPGAYHAAAFALYLTAAGLLFSIVRRLGGSARLAALTALLWGSRSAHFLAVAWFSAAQEILMVALAFGAMRLVIGGRWLKSPDLRVDGMGWGRAAGVAALTLAALLSKETAVVLPALLVAVVAAHENIPLRRAVRHPAVLAAGVVAALWLMARLLTSTLPEHVMNSSSGAGWLAGLAGLGRNLAAYPLLFFDVSREAIRHIAEAGAPPSSPVLIVWVLSAATAAGLIVYFVHSVHTVQSVHFAHPASSAAPLARAAFVWGAAAMIPPLLHTQAFYGYYMMLANGGWCLLAALGIRALARRAAGQPTAVEDEHGRPWAATDGHGWQKNSFVMLAVVALIAAMLCLSATAIRLDITLPGGAWARAHAVERGLERLKAAHPAPRRGAAIVLDGLDAASASDARLWRSLGWGAAMLWLWGDGSLRVYSAFQPMDVAGGASAAGRAIITIPIKDYIARDAPPP